MTSTLARGPVCPTPHMAYDRIQLGHGSGGKMSAALVRDLFLPHFSNESLDKLGDGAVVSLGGHELIMSTDTFVVNPLEFPGGNIGSLAVHGTVNDVAMMGADPQILSAGFVLEEGLPIDLLERVLRTMAAAAADAGVTLVTGDTKVVERGKADGMFINTTGIGVADKTFRPSPDQTRPGDAILVSGPIGRHGIAVMAARNGIAFETELESDSAALSPLVRALRESLGPAAHTLRDPTRGGLASAFNEIAVAAGVGIQLDEDVLPIPGPVAAACEMLGFDPLYVANEGILVAVVDGDATDRALAALRSHPLGAHAAKIGMVVDRHPGIVALRTLIGGNRVVDMLPGDQLPRIC